MLRPGFVPNSYDMQAMGEAPGCCNSQILTPALYIVFAELGMEVSEGEWLEACEAPGSARSYNKLTSSSMPTSHVPGPRSEPDVLACHGSAVAEGLRSLRGIAIAPSRGRRCSRVAALGLASVGTCSRQAIAAAIPALLEGAQSFHSARNVVGWDLLTLRERALTTLGSRDRPGRLGRLLKERFLARRKEFPAVMGLVDKILKKTEKTPGAKLLRPRLGYVRAPSIADERAR